MPGIKVTGIDMHIGSQITELEPFDAAFGRLGELVQQLRADGHTIDHVDLGGGLGIPYQTDQSPPPLPRDYGETVKKHVRDLGCKVYFEPGRLITGNAGIMVTQVVYRKEGEGKTFVIVDSAMNDLIRPTLYEAWHDVRPVKEPQFDTPISTVDVVGPICETGDFLARDRTMSQLDSGDLVAVMSAGAYGAVQSSTYNSRLLIPEVLVDGDRWHVIRERPTFDEMLSLDKVPDWL